MSKTHVAAFHPDGVVEHTRSPAMDDVFGKHGEMRRVTDIGRDETGYFIQWLIGPLAGNNGDGKHRTRHSLQYLHGIDAEGLRTENVEYFHTYEDAVQREVRILAAMRKQGVRFDDA